METVEDARDLAREFGSKVSGLFRELFPKVDLFMIETAPRILHPIKYGACYRLLTALRPRASEEKLKHTATYHVRERTRFYERAMRANLHENSSPL